MSIAHVRHTSIQVLSHLHPNSNILISPPPMYCLTSIQVRSFVSHLHPCDISPPAYSLPFKSWYLHHSSIHVLSHTNPRFDISAWTPSRSRLTSIQVPRLAFHIHPSRPSTLSCCISIPARSHLNPIQVSGWASQLHPCPGSPPFSLVASLLHPHRVSPPPRSWYLHLISIHVESHLQVARCETRSSDLSIFHP